MKRQPDADDRPGPGARRRRPRRPEDGPSIREAKLARLIRAAYQAERSRYETVLSGRPVAWRIARRYDEGEAAGPEHRGVPPVWPVLARWFLANRLDPFTYIAYQFARVLLSRPPEPDRLTRPEYLAHYRQGKKLARKATRRELRLQVDTANRQIRLHVHGYEQPREDAWAAVLLDEGLELGALFRYCLAHSIGGDRFDRIAGRYEVPAAVQYRRDVGAYKATWQALLPDGFHKRSRKIYLRTLGL